MRFLSRTPVRSFVVYPVVSLLWELAVNGNQFQPNLWFAPLMILGLLAISTLRSLSNSHRRRWTGIGNTARASGIDRSLCSYTQSHVLGPHHISHRPHLDAKILARWADYNRYSHLVSPASYRRREKTSSASRPTLRGLFGQCETVDTGSLLIGNLTKLNLNSQWESFYVFFLCPVCFVPVSK
jgi:hypothetical protein